ncbi:MAG: histidine phosphatase family protein [Burkholderiales bacterium]|nr:MAG: histidine phosphatase family protein [Burkholderiales bacterium]
MPPTDLILLRHGETAWNRDRRIQGQLDTPLNDEGVRQARAAGRRLAAERARWGLASAADAPAPAMVSSDLLRCRQTAEPIATALGLDCVTDARLRERDFGVFQGRTYPDLKREDPERFERWLHRDPDYDIDGGESLRTFARRIESVLTELGTAHRGRTVVVVTHGGVLDVANRLCRGLALEAQRDFDIPNAGLNWLRFDGSRFELRVWGDVGHWQGSLDEL